MCGVFTSANYFDVLGVRPAVVRAFDATDADTHAAVAVLAHSSWTREFGADPSVIGRTILVADQFVDTVRAQAVSGGTPADRLLMARFDLQPLKLGADESETFYRDLLAGTSRLPGVEAAGAARHT